MQVLQGLKCNTESGLRRSDLIFYPPHSKPGFILEFKIAPKDVEMKSLKKLAQQAIEQIKEKNTPKNWRARPHRQLYIAGKLVAIEKENIILQ